MKRTERIEVWLSKEERGKLDRARGLTALATWIRAKSIEAAERDAKRQKGGGR